MIGATTGMHLRSLRISARRCRWALQCGASHAFLQVNDDNAAALAVCRKFGFDTRYTYHYRARPTECH